MYRIQPAGDLDEVFRNAAESQFAKALELIADEHDPGLVVHALRKRSKKLRGLLRLVQPVFREFDRENAALRQIATGLSSTRDAEVMTQTLTDLIEKDPDRKEALVPLRDRLGGEQMAEAEIKVQLNDFRLGLLKIRARSTGWALQKSGFAAVAAGLRRTYRSARKSMRTALKTGTASDFHEWRKANKNHGFHVQLLRKIAPVVLKPQEEAIAELSELLGKHHDLNVLADKAGDSPGPFGTPEQLRVLREAIATEVGALEEKIMELGRQTLAEAPKALAERYGRYWAEVSDENEGS